MTENDETGKKITHRCPICNDMGFANGEICVCITGKKSVFDNDDLPPGFRDIFGDMFGDNGSNKR